MTWPMVKLESVAVINPRLPKDADEEQKVSFVAMASASEDGRLLSEENRVLSETKKGFTYFSKGDVLLAKITPCFENGKCLRPNQISNPIGFGSTEFHVLRANVDELDSQYLFYMLWSAKFRSLGEASMSGAAGQKRVSTDFLKSFEIPLPPLDEQKRIAAILDKADAIRRKRQQAIKLADEFLRAVFLDMFGDPVTNPKGLKVSTIGDLCDVVTGSTPSRKVESYYGGDIPWVKTTEVDGYIINSTEESISEEGLRNSNCKVNPSGSIVLAMYGQGKTRGKVGILGVPAATNQACAVIKPTSNILMGYMYVYLQLSYESLRALGQGAGQPNLNLSIVKSFPVVLPDHDSQVKFVRLTQFIAGLKEKISNGTAESSSLFRSLSQKSFSGGL